MAIELRQLSERYVASLRERSHAIPQVLDREINRYVLLWAWLFFVSSLPRIVTTPVPVHGIGDLVQLMVPYALIAIAPLAGYRLAATSFPTGESWDQPALRFSLYGSWRKLSMLDARANPVFGPGGFMASLLIGLLLNVMMRSGEFLLAMPALNAHAPTWSRHMLILMTADVVLMSFFYMICFAMALKTVPLFPRMLVFAWMLDVTMQLIIARHLGAMPTLPVDVAIPLRNLLEGNIEKVLISAFVWIPYLVLSDRVNVTYRQRIGSR